jgi:pimeloyl-ACP methyl ester carboxylesterase
MLITANLPSAIVGRAQQNRPQSSRWTAAQESLIRRVSGEKKLVENPDAEGLRLRPDMESIFIPADSAKGTLVLLHGYSAGPWQYEEMSDFLHDKGYNVYVPRLPGHGLVTSEGIPTGCAIPESNEDDQWDSFVDSVYQQAAALGEAVQVIGLSGGATLGLRIAERHPEVAGVAAFAPFLGGNLPLGLLFPVVNFLDTITFGMLGNLLDRGPFGKNSNTIDNGGPHTKSSLGQALGMYQLGQKIDRVAAPVQFITTAGDSLSGTAAVSRMRAHCGDGEQTGWYHFAREDGVPHAMVSPRQSRAAEKVRDLLFEFVDQGHFIEG